MNEFFKSSAICCFAYTFFALVSPLLLGDLLYDFYSPLISYLEYYLTTWPLCCTLIYEVYPCESPYLLIFLTPAFSVALLLLTILFVF